MKIVIVDYGMGNIKSIVGALNHLGLSDVIVSENSAQIQKADKLILPGVGAFGKAIHNIRQKQLDSLLKVMVLEHKKPILGICLGMQLMCQSSTEEGVHEGLGFINNHITRFDHADIKVPHVGFNQVAINPELKLYQDMQGLPDFYFTHSFKLERTEHINQCLCNYGEEFVASYEIDNIAGVQFHPELSQNNGLKLLANFVEKF